MFRLSSLAAFVAVTFVLVASAAIAQEVTADDYLELWKPLAGTWKTTATVDGKTVEGTYSFRVSRTQKCFVTYGAGGTLPATEAIHGYDPVTKQWKVTSYDADGAYSVDVVTVVDMKKGKTIGLDYCTKSEFVRHSKDGKKTTGSSTAKVIGYDANRIEAVVTDRKENDQSQPDIRFVMERQPRRERAAKQ